MLDKIRAYIFGNTDKKEIVEKIYNQVNWENEENLGIGAMYNPGKLEEKLKNE